MLGAANTYQELRGRAAAPEVGQGVLVDRHGQVVWGAAGSAPSGPDYQVGGGLFRWDPGSNGADDDGNVIKQANQAVGRWRRVSRAEDGVVSLGDFGVGDGAFDNKDALRRAIDACFADPNAAVRTAARPLYIPPGTWRTTVPPAIASVEGFHMFGAGALSAIAIDGDHDIGLDVNGTRLSRFRDFVVTTTSAGSMQRGVALSARAGAPIHSSNTRFDQIDVRGRFRFGFHVGYASAIVLHCRLSQCRVEGQWTPSEGTWWHAGFIIDNSSARVVVNHALVQMETRQVRFGLINAVSDVRIFGANVRHAEAAYAHSTSWPSTVSGLWAADCQRLLVTGGWAAFCAQLRMSDAHLSWGTPPADANVVDWHYPGTLVLQNVHVKQAPGGPAPRMLLDPGGSASPGLALLLDGVSTTAELSDLLVRTPRVRVAYRGYRRHAADDGRVLTLLDRGTL